jgi:hypothetical protein
VAANDVWAVGYYTNGVSSPQTLTAHWNGSAWSLVPSPNQGSGTNRLQGVAARAANDVWAVGYYQTGTTSATLTEHWNGSAWSIVDSPNQGTSSFFYGVAALAANDVWAVGTFFNSPAHRTLTAHWDGSAWRIIGSPNLGDELNTFYGAAAGANGDVWAVGDYVNGGDLIHHTLVTQWQSGCWRLTTSPDGATNSTFNAAAVGPGGAVWAVGSGWEDSQPDQTLTARYQGPCPSVPPPPCPVQFADVAATDPFYPYITALACRGIVSGYTCGGPGEPCPGTYFRPGANITRGQVAKMVANAAGFQERMPSGQQTFEDVPNTDPFWVYVERLSVPTRAYISGYSCGQAPAGPCVPPGNRPYFLPGANVTRGQLAKIAANAAGYSETPGATQQTFEDVPPSQAFWPYVERVALHGVISGYACGVAPAGPCVPPGNRPYFAWANPATRGQTTKILNTTFFPGCLTP